MIRQIVKQTEPYRFIGGKSRYSERRTDPSCPQHSIQSMYKETKKNGREENGRSGLHRHPLIKISEGPGNPGKIKRLDHSHIPTLLLNHLIYRTV